MLSTYRGGELLMAVSLRLAHNTSNMKFLRDPSLLWHRNEIPLQLRH